MGAIETMSSKITIYVLLGATIGEELACQLNCFATVGLFPGMNRSLGGTSCLGPV